MYESRSSRLRHFPKTTWLPNKGSLIIKVNILTLLKTIQHTNSIKHQNKSNYFFRVEMNNNFPLYYNKRNFNVIRNFRKFFSRTENNDLKSFSIHFQADRWCSQLPDDPEVNIALNCVLTLEALTIILFSCSLFQYFIHVFTNFIIYISIKKWQTNLGKYS